MLKIRLSRQGTKNKKIYRIVVCEQRSKRDGKTIDIIGHFNPEKNDLVIDKTKYAEWIKKGARKTPAVDKLIK